MHFTAHISSISAGRPAVPRARPLLQGNYADSSCLPECMRRCVTISSIHFEQCAQITSPLRWTPDEFQNGGKSLMLRVQCSSLTQNRLRLCGTCILAAKVLLELRRGDAVADRQVGRLQTGVYVGALHVSAHKFAWRKPSLPEVSNSFFLMYPSIAKRFDSHLSCLGWCS